MKDIPEWYVKILMKFGAMKKIRSTTWDQKDN